MNSKPVIERILRFIAHVLPLKFLDSECDRLDRAIRIVVNGYLFFIMVGIGFRIQYLCLQKFSQLKLPWSIWTVAIPMCFTALFWKLAWRQTDIQVNYEASNPDFVFPDRKDLKEQDPTLYFILALTTLSIMAILIIKITGG